MPNNSTSSTFFKTMNATKTAFPISAYGLMAEKHWREFRPKMVHELLPLEDKLVADGLTMDQASRQAWEMVRERYILLPPEDDQED
jgi:hypothetical protein